MSAGSGAGERIVHPASFCETVRERECYSTRLLRKNLFETPATADLRLAV